jgi:hypothetical protein
MKINLNKQQLNYSPLLRALNKTRIDVKCYLDQTINELRAANSTTPETIPMLLDRSSILLQWLEFLSVNLFFFDHARELLRENAVDEQFSNPAWRATLTSNFGVADIIGITNSKETSDLNDLLDEVETRLRRDLKQAA